MDIEKINLLVLKGMSSLDYYMAIQVNAEVANTAATFLLS